MRARRLQRGDSTQQQRGSVLIIVLWVAFGLVSVTLYFAHSMSFELRAADNRVASLEAEQAIAGATRYVSNLLALAEVPGALPPIQTYLSAGVPVGDATFWFLGRYDQHGQLTQLEQPYFSLSDEASKLNLNTATAEMLEMLPLTFMTPELAAAIVDWRDSDSTVSEGGAEDETYQRLNPPYRCKNAKFESLEELRLVYGMDLETLDGEDANRNGILDPNENDGDASPPYDNRDGRLDPGIMEYVTVWSREPNTRTNGEARINVGSTNQQQQLTALFTEKNFSTDRANEILQNISGTGGGPGGVGSTTIRSVLEFYIRSQMTQDEFTQIENDITVSTNTYIEGLINVNTASEVVLACVPGIGSEFAPTLVAHRQSNRSSLAYTPTVAWVKDVLGETNAITAGPYLTGHSYQFTADVAALGHHGRGYQRVRTVFDTSEGLPRIQHRQDLTHLGWALGNEVRKTLLLAKERR